MKYSKRIMEIVNRLLKYTDYVSVSEIADQLSISKRTIFREMDEVEKLVQDLGMTLHKKTRLGVLLIATAAQIATFSTLFDNTKDDAYSQEARQNHMIAELLKSREPRKFYYFAALLSVSEATISYDMDKIEPWFESRGIHLVRKPGYGVYLEGQETQFRKAIVDFLYQNYAYTNLASLLQGAQDKPPMMHTVIDKEVLLKINSILEGYEESLSRRLTESAYMGLNIHLAIAVQRVIGGERIVIRGEILRELKQDIQFEIARAIGEQIEHTFCLKFPEDELGYITMHLKGSKLKTGSMTDQNDLILSNFEVTQLTARMITKFKQLSGYDLSDDDGLLIGLVAHLRPAITRLKLSLEIRNPLLDKIQEMYSEIYLMSQQSARLMEEKYNILLPPSEIGFLAMHFGASIERFKKIKGNERKIRTGVVCASGVGTSSLLYSRLSQLFPRMDLIGQFSKEDILSGAWQVHDLELIISTILIDQLDIPCIQVSPLLIGDDTERIKQVLAILGPKTNTDLDQKPLSKNNHTKTSSVQKLHEMTSAVLTLGSGFYVKDDCKARHVSDLIRLVAEEVGSGVLNKRQLQKQLLEREKLGSTLIHEEGVILIHTKSSAIKQMGFYVWRLLKPIGLPRGEAISTAIVMMLPQDAKMTDVEVMSYLSKALIEAPGFLETLKSAGEREAEASLKAVLHQWLNRRMKKEGCYDL
jgi:mannitol operon transcriptional antiterminator